MESLRIFMKLKSSFFFLSTLLRSPFLIFFSNSSTGHIDIVTKEKWFLFFSSKTFFQYWAVYTYIYIRYKCERIICSTCASYTRHLTIPVNNYAEYDLKSVDFFQTRVAMKRIKLLKSQSTFFVSIISLK